MFVIPKLICIFVIYSNSIMTEETPKLSIVYITPALYMAGGVERVLTLKANYFAEHYGYDITIILTEGKGKPFFYQLSEKIKVVNLDIGFETLWNCSFLKKIPVYLKKQHQYKKALSRELMRIRPDITISLLRREINFLADIKNGSRTIGEMHIHRANYRNFEADSSNVVKNIFAKLWMKSLVRKIKKLDNFVVLTEEDYAAWPELSNITVIPNPLSFHPQKHSAQNENRVIAVGRYTYQKGFDLLLLAWSKVEKLFPNWELSVFGDGDRTSYNHQIQELGIDTARCHLNGPTPDIEQEYANSSIFVFSSRFEGFGLVLVEAMACGLPVVSFACPCGPKDIVKDGEDGLLVENGNVDSLADGMSKLIGNPELRSSMALAARRNSQRFSIEQIAKRWKTIFESN